jgi:hypothetical protein
MIRTQMGNAVDQKMVSVAWHALYPVTVTNNQPVVGSEFMILFTCRFGSYKW